MNKVDREIFIDKLLQPICYPDGMIHDNYVGEQIPRITPENFGRLYLEMCEFKAVLIAMLEENSE